MCGTLASMRGTLASGQYGTPRHGTLATPGTCVAHWPPCVAHWPVGMYGTPCTETSLHQILVRHDPYLLFQGLCGARPYLLLRDFGAAYPYLLFRDFEQPPVLAAPGLDLAVNHVCLNNFFIRETKNIFVADELGMLLRQILQMAQLQYSMLRLKCGSMTSTILCSRSLIHRCRSVESRSRSFCKGHTKRSVRATSSTVAWM